jgi:hypothetical protein
MLSTSANENAGKKVKIGWTFKHMDLLSRISAFDYTDGNEQGGGAMSGAQRIESEESIISDDDAEEDDSQLLHQMLENLLEKSHDPSASYEETDILMESERWAPVRRCWSSRHLSSRDFQSIEGVGGGEHAALLAHHQATHGGMVWGDPDLSPLPDNR